MIVTKEQQEALLDKYIKENHNQDECIGFIDGLNAMLQLICKIESRKIGILSNGYDKENTCKSCNKKL